MACLRSFVVCVTALVLTSCGVWSAVTPSQAEPEPLILVGEPQRRLALPLSEVALDSMRVGHWDAVVAEVSAMDVTDWTEAQLADRAFVWAQALVYAGRAEEAEDLLDALRASPTAPPERVTLVEGEILKALGRGVEALDRLAEIPPHAPVYPRAAIVRAEVLRDLSRTQEAFEVYDEMVQRSDPAPGNPLALLALATREGTPSPEAYRYLRRLWTHYPSSEEERAASVRLRSFAGSQYAPTWQQQGLRAEALMYDGRYSDAISLAQARLAEASDDSQDACRYRYVIGRSFYKKNQLTNAVNGFGDAGTRCVDAEGTYGPRALYLQGTAEFRRGRYAESAKAYRTLADGYADHSMADDALTRGGISLQEGGDLTEAQKWWGEALERFPQGDTVPEAAWRLAFSHYLEGQPDAAIAAAESLAGLPLTWDAEHVRAGQYWSARWRVYPDVAQPTVLSTDTAAVEEGLTRWETLIREDPWSYYSLLAHNRLRELAPERAEALQSRPEDHRTGEEREPWRIRLSTHENERVREASALMRLGLVRDGRAVWASAELEDPTAEEQAWWIELRIGAGDWLLAHDQMRAFLKSHPLAELGGRQAQIIRLSYPDRYWDLVQTATEGDRYDGRLFHALVREESNFNRSIVSFAGARGLSQLMPATAKQTAGWLGMTIAMSDLNDPKTNLTIGARYLDAMHKEHDGNSFLALASYNAGSGRVKQWLGEWGNVPTDEFVERIPFRETRGYVKRVSGTWQTMRWQFDVDVPPYDDLSRLNHAARPDRVSE